MKKNILIVNFIFFIVLQLNAQSNKIFLKSITLNVKSGLSTQANFETNQSFNNFYYKIIQFNKIPSKQQQETIKTKGVLLLDYLPDNSYIAAIPLSMNVNELSELNANAILDMPLSAKKSNEILKGQIPEYAYDKGGNIQLVVLCYSNVNMQLVKEYFSLKKTTIVNTIDDANLITLSIFNYSEIDFIANLPFVNFIEFISPISIPDDVKGASLHRSNAINTSYGAGRKYDGGGVTVGIADDGIVGPHIDFKGRLIQLATTPGAANSHGDMTSGIAVGAGNLNPTIPGMATGARLVSFDIGAYPQIINAVTNFNTYNLTITSTSYSQGCNTYTTDSKFIDDQLLDNKQLVHVFSGGNNASANCTYGGTPGVLGWGNITGGYKVGKNVLAVANIDALGVRDASSSRGPAPDGRIKPDISANGKNQLSTAENNTYQTGGGTSAASPGIGGITAQLYQAYRNLNSGSNPDATLLKAVLLNTADEIGNIGPDYSFGFGRVNALKAAKALEQNTYAKDSLTQGDSNIVSLLVSVNTTALKVLIHWRDEGGQPTALKALVNDIDIRIIDPANNIEFPWILNPTANIASINAAATKGNDNLNNVEQITIENPLAGNYSIKTYGTTIPFSQQSYYLTYEIITNEIVMTYPMGNEGFKPGDQEVLRWDAEGNIGDFALQYSLDSGITYSNIASVIAGNIRQYTWTVPAVVSGKVFLKVTRGLYADSNDVALAIINVPTGLTVSKACQDSTTLTWNTVAGAVAYQISKLGAKYMDSLTTVTTLFATIPALATDTNWYSISAVTAQQVKGRRALAIQKLPGIINCSQPIDMSVSSINYPEKNKVYYLCDSIINRSVNLNISNVGINNVTNYTMSYKLDALPTVVEVISATVNSGSSALHTFSVNIPTLSVGTHFLKVFISTTGDNTTFNDSLTTTFKVENNFGLSFMQSFNTSPFPPLAWDASKSALSSPGWVQSANVTQKNGLIGKTAMFDNFVYNNRNGPLDELKTPIIDIPSNGAVLVFDRAYKIYPNYFDSLIILISDDCGQLYTTELFKKGYKSLATTLDSTTTIFSPISSSVWKTDSINLIAYAGKSVSIKFINKSDYGNRLFLDNINILPTVIIVLQDLKTINEVFVYPNPSVTGIYTIKTSNKIIFSVLDLNGKIIKNGQVENMGIIDISSSTSGIYYLQLIIGNEILYKKIVK